MKDKLQVQEIQSDLMGKQCRLKMVRLDLYEPDIPGNKYWKMKYNIEAMRARGLNHLVTFGGAYSNHIAAVASAGRKHHFKTTGIIRGEAEHESNTTLSLAAENGMEFRFIDRQTYRDWKKGLLPLDDYLGFGNYFLLPEGGSNPLAVKGCSEILSMVEDRSDIVACPVGTGSTLAGLIAGAQTHQQVIGFSSMKGGEYIEEDIESLLKKFRPDLKSTNWTVKHDFHFGGFAKVNADLIRFFQSFLQETGIELDLIYTAKMMFGLKEMIQSGEIPSRSDILVIHTGGQQGNVSMLERYRKLI